MIVMVRDAAQGGTAASLVLMTFSVVGMTIVATALFARLQEVHRELVLARDALGLVKDLAVVIERRQAVVEAILLQTYSLARETPGTKELPVPEQGKTVTLDDFSFYVLGQLTAGDRSGRELRAGLHATRYGNVNAPTFYAYMASMEDDKLVEGWYEPKMIGDAPTKERRFRMLPAGSAAWEAARDRAEHPRTDEQTEAPGE